MNRLVLDKIDEPDRGMELCYECEGERACIMCQGNGAVGGRRCVSCGGSRRCIVCRGPGQLPEGTYKRLVDEGLIKE